MSRFKDLKERRLIQIVVSYLAAAWIGLEVLNLFVERGQVPELLFEVALLWAVAGFGAALLVGWYHGERGKQRAPLSEILALVLIGFASAGLSGSMVYDHMSVQAARDSARESALNLSRVAVLYFEDLSRDGSTRYIADGITEGLIDELSNVQELDVVSRAGVGPFRGQPVDYDSVVARLDPGTIVAGSVEPDGDRVRVGIRLVDASGNAYRRRSLAVPADELASADDRVVEETAQLLREWMGQELDVRRTSAGTTSSEAWALYHRGEAARKDAEAAAAERDRPAMVAAFERADSLLTLARDTDPDWAEPRVLRARVAYQRSRMAASMEELLHWAEKGLDRIEHVLERRPNHARANELRGTLIYWGRWLNDPPPDPERSRQVFEEARRSLERAVELDPGLASAYASLTHVYLNVPSLTDALIAGQRAYEEDAFLKNAPKVVKRNTDAAYNLEQFSQSRRWCEIGQERFPGNYYFSLCEILLMTTPVWDADPDRAPALVARVDSLAPSYQAPFERLRARIVYGGVLAVAGMPDSARTVWESARERWTPEIDPAFDLPFTEAYMRTLAGDRDEAIALLKRVAAAYPGLEFGGNWWWRGLQDHPDWQDLVRGVSPAP